MSFSIRQFALIIIALIAAAGTTLTAQESQGALNHKERIKALEEIRVYRHDVLVKELEMTSEQQREFFPLYDEMNDQLQKLNNETRELERSMLANESASDTELEAAAGAIFAQKMKEGKIEMEYLDKFKDILTPRQLIKLKSAEKKFTQTLVRHHRRLRER